MCACCAVHVWHCAFLLKESLVLLDSYTFVFSCLQHLCPNFTLCIVSFNFKLLLNLTYLHCRMCHTLLHYKWADPFVRWDARLSGAYLWVRRIFGSIPPEVCCMLYFEHLHSDSVNGCMQRNWKFVFTFFFMQTRKPDCLIKQGFVNVLSHVSFEGIFCGVAKHGCVFSFFLFFSLHVWQQIWSCTYARECTTCQLHCTWKMNLGGAAGILLDWLGCVRAF